MSFFRTFLVISGLFGAVVCAAGRVGSVDIAPEVHPDSSALAVLGSKLGEYAGVIERESAQVKCGETDFLIESCADSVVRQYTALWLYSHYIGSRVMGDEAVAVHIYDRWFASGAVKMKSELDLMNARIFAEFNRRSLLGQRAPALEMEAMDGSVVRIFGDREYRDRMSVLFFYDSGCGSCKAESIMLRSLLSGVEYDLDFYAIYTSGSREAWESFVDEYLNFDNQRVRVHHLWDPEVSSDFQMKYGVLQTPRMFLVSRDGLIVGRGLDATALVRLVEIYGAEAESPEGQAFGAVMEDLAGRSPLGGRLPKVSVRGVLVRGDVGFGEDAVDFGSGGDVVDAVLGGDVVDAVSGLGKEVSRRLDRLRNTVVVFYTRGCGRCEEELEALLSRSVSGSGFEDRAGSDFGYGSRSLSKGRQKYFLVDMDEVILEDEAAAYKLFAALDLTVMPYITATDRRGRVAGKYLSFLE